MKNTNKSIIKQGLLYSAVALLFALMIFMFAEYCLLKNSASYSKLPELSTGDSVFFNYTDSENAGAGSIISPGFIGIVSEKKLTPHFGEERNKMLETVKPFVSAVFSDVSTLVEFSSEKARLDYAEKEIYSKNNYVYISFDEQIPASAVYPSLTGETLDNIYHGFSVKELFIFCDNLGTLSGAVLDCDGNIATLKVRERTSLSFDTITAYADTYDMAEFEFASAHGKKYPVLKKSVSTFDIAAYTDNGDFLTENSDDASTILEAFGFNPNGTRFYHTRNDAITYVESPGELRISALGDVHFTSFSDGIDLSMLSGKQKDAYSFEDKISISHRILSSLDTDFYGGSGELSLSDVSYDSESGKLTLRFSYILDGIKISGYENCGVLVFGENSLVSADIKAKSFKRLETKTVDIPQKLHFALYSSGFDAENLPYSFLPIYQKDGENNIFKAKYAFSYHSSPEQVHTTAYPAGGQR